MDHSSILGLRFFICIAVALVTSVTANAQITEASPSEQAPRNILYGLVTTGTTQGEFALLSITNLSTSEPLSAELKVFTSDQSLPISSHQVNTLGPAKTTMVRVPQQASLSYYELSYPKTIVRPVVKVETGGDRSFVIYSGSSSLCSTPQTLQGGLEYFLLMRSPQPFTARFIAQNDIFTRTLSTGGLLRRLLSLNVSNNVKPDLLSKTSAKLEPLDQKTCLDLKAHEQPVVIAAQVKAQRSVLGELRSDSQALLASQRGEAYTFSRDGSLISAPFSPDMVPVMQPQANAHMDREEFVVVRIPALSVPPLSGSVVAAPVSPPSSPSVSIQPIPAAPAPEAQNKPSQDVSQSLLPPAPNRNNPPQFTLKPPPNTTVQRGTEQVFYLTANDPDPADGSRLLFKLKENNDGPKLISNIVQGTARFSFTPQRLGTFPFEVTVTDPSGAQAVALFTITATDITPPSNTLTILSPGPLTVKVPGSLSATFRSQPPGASFSLVSDGGLRGLTLTPDGLVFGTFARHQIGRYSAQVAASLGTQKTNASISIDLLPNTANSPPTIAALPTLLNKTVGYPVQLLITAHDPDGDPVTLSLQNPPRGASLQRSTGGSNEHLFTWIPSAVGNYTLTVVANDLKGGTDTRTFSVQVVSQPQANRPPRIAPIPNFEIRTTDEWRYKIDASDPDNDPLSYYVFQNAYGLPPGFQYDKDSGLMAWTPAINQYGVYPINYRVSDTQGNSAQGRFELKVTRYTPPAVRFDSIRWKRLTAIAGQRFEQQWYVTKNGSKVEPSTLRFSALERPLSSNVTNGGLVNWIPSYFDIGKNFRFTALVTDNDGASGVVDQNIRVVARNSPPRTPTGSTHGGLTKVAVGKTLAYRIPFQDADGDLVKCYVPLVIPGAPTVSEDCDVRFSPTRNQLFSAYSVMVYAFDGTDRSQYQFDVVVVQ